MEDKVHSLTARNFPTAVEDVSSVVTPSRYSGPESSYKLAFADMDFNAGVNCTNVPASLCAGGTQSIRAGFNDTRIGGVIGGGVEVKPASNWIFGVEYLYYRFNDTNTGGGSWRFANGAPAPFYDCTVAGQNCARFSYGEVGLHTLRARLSYQFNSPVVAKY